MRDFVRDNSAWADFLISKAALILASVVFFAALFHLVAGFKELEAQEQMDFLARDFKTAVDEAGSGKSGSGDSGSGDSGSGDSGSDYSRSGSLSGSMSGSLREGAQQGFHDESQDEFHESLYCFEEKEIFRNSPFAGDLKVRISGEYVCLEAGAGERSFRAVKPFAFRVLPFNESVMHEKLSANFGTQGSKEFPLKAGYSEIETFLRALGTEEAVLNPNKGISLKKELIYLENEEEVSVFGCVLVYQ